MAITHPSAPLLAGLLQQHGGSIEVETSTLVRLALPHRAPGSIDLFTPWRCHRSPPEQISALLVIFSQRKVVIPDLLQHVQRTRNDGRSRPSPSA